MANQLPSLTCQPVLGYIPAMSALSGKTIETPQGPRHSKFWEQFPGLVWSNSRASDIVMIRAALSRPRFEQLLKIAVEFGLDQVRNEWAVLDKEDTGETQRARPIVERILRNIKKGFSNAKA